MYWHNVYSDSKGTIYQGHDAADAMAAWSKAVSENAGYVAMESLQEGRSD